MNGRLESRRGVVRRAARCVLIALVVICCRTATSPHATSGEPERSDAPRAVIERLFATRVQPVLRSKCFGCHGEDKDNIRGALSVETRALLLRGGESGEAAIVPGDPDGSLLFQAINWDGLEMPPKESDRLTDVQIRDIRQWIAGGAPWPDKNRQTQIAGTKQDQWQNADGVRVKTSGGLSPDWTNRRYRPADLWAYRPLAPPDDVVTDANGRNPIDEIIRRRAARAGVPLAPLADRRTLIRRATFDLLGLPPAPQDISAFLQDPASDEVAFARVVDQLLASPHYGEQWARHWLDVVRYADTSGFANDYARGNAWRYRDYVVRAFNTDRPYDQFIREQIAGDELDSTSAELRIAVGFLRMGPWELTAMEVPRVARQRFLDDVTDAVGEVFLGQMLQCARCHDHKFDPIPTRDYYAMQSVFATTQLAERRTPFLGTENLDGFADKKYVEQRIAHYRKLLKELDKKRTVAAARQWYQEQHRDATAFDRLVADQQKTHPATAVKLQKIRQQLADQGVDPALIPPRHVGFEPRDFGMERIARKGIERLTWELDRYAPFALSVYSGRTPQRNSVTRPQRVPKDYQTVGELEESHILAGGDPFSPVAAVQPAVLSVIDGMAPPSSESPRASVPTTLAGRRSALANWIASKNNPLTARVMVNRIWQWHFGRPIAGNPNNFGATGKKPTHPALLDYLAAQFVRRGWSVKAMHRLIMNSESYRRSSSYRRDQKPPDVATVAKNFACFAPRRLDAEEIRDALLSVSGEINLEVGGSPVRPEMNMEAALQPRQVMGTFAEAWQPSPLPQQRHRRSIYALRIRGQRDPLFDVFNAPNADVCCEARDTSIVTPQVFALFNSGLVYGRALAAARHVWRVDGSRTTAIQRLFVAAYGRAARPAEVDLCMTHWTTMERRHAALQFPTTEYPRNVLREAVEENTGTRFQFIEPLEVQADFVPDVRPGDVDAAVRALAEVCLVVFNSSEFVYVY